MLCADVLTGKLRWAIDRVKDYGTTVPPWYTGQCPLLDGNRVILAPGGTNTFLMAVDLSSGQVLWRTPNPRAWKMTHSSVMPVDVAGRRMFVYCASGGVLGVSAQDGAILWDTTDWKISLATVPCPLDFGQGRIFLTGGYNAGSLVLQLKEDGPRLTAEIALRLSSTGQGGGVGWPRVVGSDGFRRRPSDRAGFASDGLPRGGQPRIDHALGTMSKKRQAYGKKHLVNLGRASQCSLTSKRLTGSKI